MNESTYTEVYTTNPIVDKLSALKATIKLSVREKFIDPVSLLDDETFSRLKARFDNE